MSSKRLRALNWYIVCKAIVVACALPTVACAAWIPTIAVEVSKAEDIYTYSYIVSNPVNSEHVIQSWAVDVYIPEANAWAPLQNIASPPGWDFLAYAWSTEFDHIPAGGSAQFSMTSLFAPRQQRYSIIGAHLHDGALDVEIEGQVLGPGVPVFFRADFDTDFDVDANDINLLVAAVRDTSQEFAFDLDGSGKVDADDLREMVHGHLHTWFGDSNLDGLFNSGDFIKVFQTGQYEDRVGNNSRWSTGDWNGDGDFDSGDLVIAFQDGGFEQGPRGAVSTIPEPSAYSMAWIASCCMLARRHRSTCISIVNNGSPHDVLNIMVLRALAD